ncbi:MAG TPA: hypothetical protein DEP72_01330 [Clostridiales bacterium]|nr:MAG: hypothetical protein A2Y18_05655 [Clostridiales bacterium GWD2_32_19]HCC06795.1 hypothetical protein [Clostridiales bacterium]
MENRYEEMRNKIKEAAGLNGQMLEILELAEAESKQVIGDLAKANKTIIENSVDNAILDAYKAEISSLKAKIREYEDKTKGLDKLKTVCEELKAEQKDRELYIANLEESLASFYKNWGHGANFLINTEMIDSAIIKMAYKRYSQQKMSDIITAECRKTDPEFVFSKSAVRYRLDQLRKRGRI